MRLKPYLTNIAIIVVVVVLAGCGGDGSAVDAAAEILPTSESVADLQLAGESVAVAGDSGPGASIETSLGDESIGPFGLLAPALPGLGLEAYSTSCDPFEDPYGTCL